MKHATSIPPTAVLALSLAAFGSGMSLRLTDAQLPRLAADFGVSLASASDVITCFSVAYGISQLFFGPLGDRFGKYLVIAWASACCAMTALLCAIAPNFPLLLAARFLAGATAAALIPLSMAWIGDVIAYEDRQPVLARFLIGQILGVSAGVFVGGMAADYLNWRIPFFGIAMGFVLISLKLFSLNRRLPEHARQTVQGEGAAGRRMMREFSQVLSGKWARIVLATVFLEGLFLYGAFAFIATHVHVVHGLPLSKAGLLVMLFGFGGVLFATAARTLVRRLGEAGLTLWGGMIASLSLLGIGIGPHWIWALPGCFFAGVGFYMLHNTLQINATQMAPERRGAAVSAFASCFFIGQSAGVGMAGLLADYSSTTTVLILGAVGLLTLSLNFSRLQRKKP
ncbi:MFS transporter|uniref:MFS transporter n=1 Tax=Noviherbaspirillum sp. L7-7A TaxID=2850560 RepID=UPI001C2B975A|nr:MFS transporter [Noviherbaspirillum sp. L7-7A]MBV0880625.1 MFS transporter [Noviherbaspirillum sp. L7-7A]